jgi:hypothetical protein
LKLSDKKTNRFLLIIEGLGAAFTGIFLAAYVGGLIVGFLTGQELTMVLHSDLLLRVPLFVLGGVLLFLIFAAFVPLVLSDN